MDYAFAGSPGPVPSLPNADRLPRVTYLSCTVLRYGKYLQTVQYSTYLAQ